MGLGNDIFRKTDMEDITPMVNVGRDLKEVQPSGGGELQVMGTVCAKVLSNIQVACVLQGSE